MNQRVSDSQSMVCSINLLVVKIKISSKKPIKIKIKIKYINLHHRFHNRFHYHFHCISMHIAIESRYIPLYPGKILLLGEVIGTRSIVYGCINMMYQRLIIAKFDEITTLLDIRINIPRPIINTSYKVVASQQYTTLNPKFLPFYDVALQFTV